MRNAFEPCERRQIEAELDLAQAELTLAIAELDGRVEAEPPFQGVVLNRVMHHTLSKIS